MSENVLKLAINQVDPERRQAAKELLEKFAQNDQIQAAFVVLCTADGKWLWDWDGKAFVTELIGKIDIAKHEMIRKYLESV